MKILLIIFDKIDRNIIKINTIGNIYEIVVSVTMFFNENLFIWQAIVLLSFSCTIILMNGLNISEIAIFDSNFAVQVLRNVPYRCTHPIRHVCLFT